MGDRSKVIRGEGYRWESVSVREYKTEGSAQWRGPYLQDSAPHDPWGRPYLVTVVSGHSDDNDVFKRLFVLSAGPDGVIDTNGRLDTTTEISGDDLGAIVSQRR